MIEVNLIPEVKLELLRTRRRQRLVISGSVVLAIASVAIVTLLSVYAFGVQTVANSLADNSVNEQAKKLESITDLSQSLTLQAQLSKLNEVENGKLITSRLFDVLTVAIPEGANEVKISKLSFNSEENIIEIEAEAANGYEAMEVFKKTLAQTTFHYDVDGTAADPVSVAYDISEGERSYGEDNQGNRILRFTLSFSYPDELFDATLSGTKVVAPSKQRATDSTQGIPAGLFGSSEAGQ